MIKTSNPKADGYHMPGEFEKQQGIWMIWPKRPDNWRLNAAPAQEAYAQVAKAIAQFEPVTMIVDPGKTEQARALLPENIRIIEAPTDDAWVRDCGPSFVTDGKGGLRAVDWTFNAWGGKVDGLYDPWDNDDALAARICELQGVDRYRTEGFVLEGGSFHVDGEGTVITTEMCLLSEGRNPHLNKKQIEKMLLDYLGAEKVIWIKDGIDPEETNGHVDDVCCFACPGEVICIWTDDLDDPFYEASHAAFKTLSEATDAKGRKLKVHKLCLPKKPVVFEYEDQVKKVPGSQPRRNGDICIASYANFLICNEAVIVPQYGDENDELALKQLAEIFPNRKVVGVYTREIVYGGGNIHCITQQVPEA